MPDRMSPTLRTALFLWLAVALAVAARTLFRPDRHTVYPVYAGAGAHWLSGQSLYAAYKPLDYFRYPPVCAMFFSSLAGLGLSAGGVLWSWLNLTVYAVGLWRFRRAVLPSDWTPCQEAIFLGLATIGALRGLWNAQSNALAVGLLLLGIAALARQGWWWAAGWWAIAVWLKLTPLALVLLFCALWPRALAGRFIVAMCVGALVPFLGQSPDAVIGCYADWIDQLTSLSAERWPGFRDAWTVWLVGRRLLTGATGEVPLREPLLSPTYRLLQLAAAGACLAWCLVQRRRSMDQRNLILSTLGMGAAWLMLFGPAVEHATYVFLAPSLAAAVATASAASRRRWLAPAAGLLVFGLGWQALVGPLAPAFPALLLVLPVGTTLFAIALAREAGRDDRCVGLALTEASREPARELAISAAAA